MSYRLYAPGERKNNKFYVAIIKAGDRRVETSTKALTRSDAKRVAEEVERKLLIAQPPRGGDVVTFPEAVRRYCAFWESISTTPRCSTDASREDAKRIQKLIAVLGKERLTDISHATLVDCANTATTSRRPRTARS